MIMPVIKYAQKRLDRIAILKFNRNQPITVGSKLTKLFFFSSLNTNKLVCFKLGRFVQPGLSLRATLHNGPL
jgi:hypothetical protein